MAKGALLIPEDPQPLQVNDGISCYVGPAGDTEAMQGRERLGRVDTPLSLSAIGPEPTEISGRSKRQASNPHAVGVNHNHRSRIKIGDDRLQIGVQQRCQLTCTTLALPTHEHKRR